jgi:hypothetical protein
VVRHRLLVNYGQLPGQIRSRQKSPPLVPLGLHGLFVGFRTINTTVVFSVTLLQSTRNWHIAFSRSSIKINKPIQTQGKKTFALQPPPPCCICARKNNPKLLYITCSYIRSPPDGETTGINIT